MWIETEEGALANSERLSLISKRPVPAPGSSAGDPGYQQGLTWKVVGETDRDLFVLAGGLTEPEGIGLMERLRSALRHAQFFSVPVELRHIRALDATGVSGASAGGAGGAA